MLFAIDNRIKLGPTIWRDTENAMSLSLCGRVFSMDVHRFLFLEGHTVFFIKGATVPIIFMLGCMQLYYITIVDLKKWG